jgi:N-methylhydantoinase B/oxoprolinase/acetone carboxylase alpha subunit
LLSISFMKERLDFSCALFTKDGGLVANAPHIPVHLGAMQSAVRFQVEYWNSEGRESIQEGDVLVSNHPQLAGGSHLPDITVITPVFYKGDIIFFVASRGHHGEYCLLMILRIFVTLARNLTCFQFLSQVRCLLIPNVWRTRVP